MLTKRALFGSEESKSKNFLRLFCQLCIREERYDQVAFGGYKEALATKIYIKDLENHYIVASWQGKEDIDLNLLKHFTKIQLLDKAIKEYIYLSVITPSRDNFQYNIS